MIGMEEAMLNRTWSSSPFDQVASLDMKSENPSPGWRGINTRPQGQSSLDDATYRGIAWHASRLRISHLLHDALCILPVHQPRLYIVQASLSLGLISHQLQQLPKPSDPLSVVSY